MGKENTLFIHLCSPVIPTQNTFRCSDVFFSYRYAFLKLEVFRDTNSFQTGRIQRLFTNTKCAANRTKPIQQLLLKLFFCLVDLIKVLQYQSQSFNYSINDNIVSLCILINFVRAQDSFVESNNTLR